MANFSKITQWYDTVDMVWYDTDDMIWYDTLGALVERYKVESVTQTDYDITTAVDNPAITVTQTDYDITATVTNPSITVSFTDPTITVEEV
jgi:hypothetical protein